MSALYAAQVIIAHNDRRSVYEALGFGFIPAPIPVPIVAASSVPPKPDRICRGGCGCHLGPFEGGRHGFCDACAYDDSDRV